MFWKKTEEPPKSETKTCCSKNKEGESVAPPVEHDTAPQGQNIERLSFFGGEPSGLKLVGQCYGGDPDSINACVWTPVDSSTKHTVFF